MPLSLHIDPEVLAEHAVDDVSRVLREAHQSDQRGTTSSTFAGRYDSIPVPKYQIPEKGLSEDATYELIKNELLLDGKPGLNLASFVHTWMPERAHQLMSETIGINLCDQDEYPATMSIHARCVSSIANLWKAPKVTYEDGKKRAAMGTATTGSSEAIMLALLAAKRRWQMKRKAQGKSIHEPGPNLVFGSNVQVAIEKFARYWDVEERAVNVDESTHYCLDAKRAMEKVDENTIAVVVILGSTYTGHYEPVLEMSHELDAYQAKTGIDVPIHVDAASGGFVAPFAHPNLKWSFEIERVTSINASGHKFGMVYPGVGWVVFRSAEMVPDDLVFELHYLGSVEYSFGLNFSRPAAPVLGQMFNFISLGKEGFTKAMQCNLQNARLLSRALELSGHFLVLSDIHRPASKAVETGLKTHALDKSDAKHYMAGLPVVAFRWTDEFKAKHPHLEQRWVQILMRAKGWIVPNYELPPNLQKVQILRVVVRDSMSADLIDQLVNDILSVTEDLASKTSQTPAILTDAQSQGGASQDKDQKHGRGRHVALFSRSKDSSARPQFKQSQGHGYAGQC
ncbi:glutamate decarboxylase [Malassezia psittaci]|uniref:Glutamate decarboxylase n=1 Tax=Malassezia psittaci TaxID=1821823 RepID=A0AAF0FAM0_9BASI|nr:glutamate decarboxylase [Malassezia psittaci]